MTTKPVAERDKTHFIQMLPNEAKCEGKTSKAAKKVFRKSLQPTKVTSPLLKNVKPRKKTIQGAFFNSIKKGNLKKVQKLLSKKGIHPDLRNKDYKTALFLAVEFEQPKIVKLFLNNGAKLWSESFTEAIENEESMLNFIERLFKHDFTHMNFNGFHREGLDPSIFYAPLCKNGSIITTFIDKIEDPKIKGLYALYSLILAIRSGSSSDTIGALLSKIDWQGNSENARYLIGIFAEFFQAINMNKITDEDRRPLCIQAGAINAFKGNKEFTNAIGLIKEKDWIILYAKAGMKEPFKKALMKEVNVPQPVLYFLLQCAGFHGHLDIVKDCLQKACSIPMSDEERNLINSDRFTKYQLRDMIRSFAHGKNCYSHLNWALKYLILLNGKKVAWKWMLKKYPQKAESVRVLIKHGFPINEYVLDPPLLPIGMSGPPKDSLFDDCVRNFNMEVFPIVVGRDWATEGPQP